jgi:hypothetical protein
MSSRGGRDVTLRDTAEVDALTPTALEIYVGSFAEASYGLWWDEDHLIYESFLPAYDDRAQIVLTPSRAQWARFWKTIDEIGVWDWRNRYHAAERFEPPEEIRDGTHWSLTLSSGGRSVESCGDSAGPDATDLDDSRAFQLFVQAVSRLIGGHRFS